MRKTLSILLISVVYILILSVNGLSQQLGSRAEIYTIENGLSQTGVNCLLLDSRGYLWIGTQDGLDRYDGNSFQVFRHQPSDSNSLCDNYIRDICEDHEGNLWIATNFGLSKYSLKTSTFINFLNDPNNPNSISDNSLYSVFEDRDNIIWVKTLESIEKFDRANNRFVHYYHYNNVFNYITGDFYCKIFEDKSGKLWVGTKDGLNCFDKSLELFERFESKPEDNNSLTDNKIKVISEDAEGNIWIGTDKGLNKYNKTSKKFTRFLNQTGNKKSIVGNSINELYFENKHKLWIGTETGISVLNTNTGEFEQFSSLYCKNQKVTLSGVSSILKDSANLLWIGTYKGLIKIDMKPLKFNLFRKGKFGTESSESYDVASIYSDDKEIWIGTWGDGLVKYSLSDKKELFFNTRTLPGTFENDKIITIYDDKSFYIWLGTENGIVLYNTKTKAFKNLSSIINDCSFLENNRVFSILQDNNNWHWICTEHGLHKVNLATSKSETYVQIPDSSGIAVHIAYCITEDKDGILWIGTDRGLIRYNQQTGEHKLYVASFKNDRNSLASNSIYSVLCTQKNEIWVGTTSGLCLYNRKSDNFTVFTEKEGLPNNLIYSLEEDNEGNIWMSTNKGIVQYDSRLESFNDFDLADGLQSYEFNIGSSFKTASGMLYFGGINGFNSFKPDTLQINKSKPNIEITGVEVLSGGVRSKIAVWPDRHIVIPSSVNMFTISFAVLDFTYPQNNQYMYMLTSDGKEGLWIKNGSRNFVTFSNLPAGSYMFKVKGTNSDQVLGDKEYVIYFSVESPLWKRQWVIVLYILVLVIGGYSIVQLRTKKLRRTNKELLDKEQVALEVSRQKEELTTKNKNITDSINYAKRIQVAMMPSEKVFRRILPNSFVYHKPKDIVSGDFYWIFERGGKVFVAAVDCTGHGVPGAFMSILGVELFRKITLNQTEDPGKILGQLNEDFSRIFSDIDDISLKDGMDIAFCVINKTKYELQFAGAFNPLYLIRDNKIIDFKGDRFSVSMEQKQEDQIFNTHTIQLQKDDMFYIFSDGYADQFGGYEGKKFKYRRFRHLLLNIHKLPLESQKAYLDESMDAWRGTNEQVDDLMVIGIKADFS